MEPLYILLLLLLLLGIDSMKSNDIAECIYIEAPAPRYERAGRRCRGCLFGIF
jgi:hypothetical protein